MFDRKRLADIADWEAVMVAVSLPWSTSATSILLAAWLLTVLATLDVETVRAEVKTAAGGLPVLLWLLAVFGMLWADVSWSERIDGLSSFLRLLMIPLLLAQFRRSKNGVRVLYGFFGSAVALLLGSWTLWLAGIGQDSKHGFGVPAHDPIAQSTIFLICAFALIWRVSDLLRQRNWQPAMWLAGLAALFLANLVFVANSRGDVVVIPFLVALLGSRQFGWKGAIVACVAGSIVAAGAWASSSYLRYRIISAITDIQDYRLTHGTSDVGDHIEFLQKSITFVRPAPLVGHGTGSIRDMFRRSAVGKTGAAGDASVNPHNQILAVAIQLGLLGTLVLLAMWVAHYFLFCDRNFAAWIGTVVVVENVISSLTSSHLFDFVHGWLYVLGVGVLGGITLRCKPAAPAAFEQRAVYQGVITEIRREGRVPTATPHAWKD